ncbi:MAG: hypothetical protein M3Y74_21815 [Chloroflexota bacterium]|nr:hypothetical protein [Chloroflexota bacterium]
MTPLAGFIIAILAGLLVRPARRAMAGATLPWLAVLAVQTWHLSSGHGVNPASTIQDPSYWVVQILIGAATLGIAAGMSAWRSRHVSDPHGGAMSTARLVTLSAIATLAATAIALPLSIVASSGTGTGHGAPPLAGIGGLLACVLALAILAGAEVRARRASDAEQRAPRAG